MGWPSIAETTSSGFIPVVQAGPPGTTSAITTRELKALSNVGRNRLRNYPNFSAVRVAVFPQALVNEIDDARRDRKTQPFTASAAAQHERVQPDHSASNVQQRPSAIAGVNGRVGLQVHHRVIGIGL